MAMVSLLPLSLLLLLPSADALAASASAWRVAQRPGRVPRASRVVSLGYENLDTSLAAVVQLQCNANLEYCSADQFADAPTEEQLEALFTSLDADGSGRIDASELRARKVDAQKIVRLADRDADALIDSAEFTAAFSERTTQRALWSMIGRDPSTFVSGLSSGEASFTVLFTHETWKAYTGRPILKRWLVSLSTWRFSTVLRAVFPISALAALWAYMVAQLPAALLPRTSPVPMSLMGTALGLLLVFRTNNSYLRLAEARRLWSELLVTLRELGQGVATALMYDRRNAQSAAARDSAGRVCRYLACLAWELRARLQGGPTADDTSVLEALLDPDEAAYVAAGRLRPAALIGFVRCELHDQYVDGRLPAHIHRTLEGHLSSLDNIVGACGRLFSSPLPPTMSRHIVRCLQLWLFGFPFVLAGTMAPLPCALWVFATSYAFVGIDEVGVQVEQPFDIVPMYKLCLVAMQNLEEAFVRLPPRGRERQQAA